LPFEPPNPSAPSLADLPAVQLASLIRSGQVSPLEAVDDVIARIVDVDPLVHAVVTLCADEARHASGSMTAATSTAPNSFPPLWGVPVTVKDLTPTAGIRTTRGHTQPRRWAPDVDAVAIERLRSAGAVIVAKTNTCEEGWKGETSNRLGPPTLNPWDRAVTAGGSSGGAAVAAACGFGPMATGTDGAGSIRIPAAFCGVIGFKPTFGAIPYWPASAEGLSHLGSLTRTVDDAALFFETLIGADPRDPTSDRTLHPRDPAGIGRIGVIGGSAAWPVDPAISSVLRSVADGCSRQGLQLDEAADLPDVYEPLEIILAAFEAAPYRHGNLEADAPHIDQGRLAVIERGLRLGAADLAWAQEQRHHMTSELTRLWDSYDLLLMPSTPVLPFGPGATGPDGTDEPVGRLRWASFSYPWNLTGDPACSLPAGQAAGLPVGVQLVGPKGRDRRVLDVARRLETAGIVGFEWPPMVHGDADPSNPDNARHTAVTPDRT
jgi:aspartyl-tRNA(Asn)/glutamyl-tRNA(Gln) amidotransferase subunit A